jgi:hypothetical protein
MILHLAGGSQPPEEYPPLRGGVRPQAVPEYPNIRSFREPTQHLIAKSGMIDSHMSDILKKLLKLVFQGSSHSLYTRNTAPFDMQA